MNMYAWADCLSYRDDEISRFTLPAEESLIIEVLDSDQLRSRTREIYLAVHESVDFINQRNLDAVGRARIPRTFR
jgi:hypothetical protein